MKWLLIVMMFLQFTSIEMSNKVMYMLLLLLIAKHLKCELCMSLSVCVWLLNWFSISFYNFSNKFSRRSRKKVAKKQIDQRKIWYGLCAEEKVSKVTAFSSKSGQMETNLIDSKCNHFMAWHGMAWPGIAICNFFFRRSFYLLACTQIAAS